MTPAVVINNRNRLSTTKKLVEDLQKLGYYDIHIIDNGSTYPDLLEYYQHLKNQEFGPKIHRYDNIGPRAIYDTGLINQFPSWIAYTDSDIELNPRTPGRFIEEIIYQTEKYGYKKGGLALQVDDIAPHHSGYRWRDWESRFWNNPLAPGIYAAEIDTTFCIVKKDIPFSYPAIRIADCYTAKHIPWYTEFDWLSQEEHYYLEHSSPDSTYYRIYQEWKNK